MDKLEFNSFNMNRPHVELLYRDIMEKIQDLTLFGDQMDLNDPKMVVVGAYLYGWSKSLPWYKPAESE